MRITNIRIENFGIYKDFCEIRFEYNPEKRVTLLKGENGSGKTTLLNSIKTALYGPMIFGSKRSSNIKYIEFINQMLNTDARKNPSSEYGIEIDIITNLPTFSGTYKIKRVWQEHSSKMKEGVSIFHNGERLTEDAADSFFNMFYKMYPLELFELYYLDGEKIDQLSFFNGDIYSLIETSMNIDLFKVLRNDLETYAIKKNKSEQLDQLKHEKDNNIARKVELESKTMALSEKLVDFGKEEYSQELLIQKLSKEIESANQNLPEQIKNANEELKDIKKELSKQITDVVPLVLLQNAMDVLIRTVEVEQENAKARMLDELLHDELKAKILLDLEHTIKEDQINQIFKILKSQYSSKTNLLHNLNSDEYHALRVLKSRINQGSKEYAISIFEKYSSLQKRIRGLNEEMSDYDETFVAKLLQELLEANEELQRIRGNIEDVNTKILRNKIEIESIKSKNIVLESDIWKGMKSENVTEVVKSMKAVIDRYIDTIKSRKIHGIEVFTKEMFEALLRKKNFVKQVKITEKEIYIETIDNNRFNVTNLSSGERQLFVLSIIYALFKVSERSTPLIFDTLLGRLDKNHQQEVMAKFIASCPDQVIILATDSELENIKKQTLAELVNTRYSIDLSKNDNRIEMII
jgi:DNA sulfur modification protein DndD